MIRDNDKARAVVGSEVCDFWTINSETIEQWVGFGREICL